MVVSPTSFTWCTTCLVAIFFEDQFSASYGKSRLLSRQIFPATMWVRFMIAYLKGKIIFSASPLKKTAFVIMDVNGVGYRVMVPLKHIARYQAPDQTIELFTYHHSWDGGQELYGFMDKGELDFFSLLIDIPGIGPKSALNILNHAGMVDVRQAVIENDAETFSKTSGLGKKTAEKIILGLKDRLSQIMQEGDGQTSTGGSLEVVEALMSLGFPREHIQKALSKIPSDIQASEDKIKAALKFLGQKK